MTTRAVVWMFAWLGFIAGMGITLLVRLLMELL